MTEEKIKIAVMIDNLDLRLGGTENQVIKLLRGLDRDAFEVELISFNANAWLESNGGSLLCSSRIFAINRFKQAATYANLFRLTRYLRSSRTEIVHTFFPVANIVGVLAARMAGIRSVISSRRDCGVWMNPRYLAATRFANRFVMKIIANSQEVKEFTVDKEKADQERVEVIYNGIEKEYFEKPVPDHALRERLKIPPGNRVIGLVANFSPVKHHFAFVKGACQILKRRPDVSFLLIGDGPLRAEIEAMADAAGVGAHFIFTGVQKEVLPYLSIMDAGVNCSEHEGLSNAIIEYMAAEVPCVVTAAGGNRELIVHGETGYTFPVDDYAAMASFLLKILEDAEASKKLVAMAKEKARREMSLDAMIAKHEAYYHQLAGR
jgi:glycosyltransferase involved in cell wall biosynthesis